MILRATPEIAGAAGRDRGHDLAPLVALSGVAYEYPDGLQALENTTFEVRVGEVLAVTGPSGCGKSTLLSLLGGSKHPTGGAITWFTPESGEEDRGGRRYRKRAMTPSRRRLTLVFQRDTVLPWKTVEENVAFGMRYVSMGKREKEERVTSLLHLAKLQEFRHVYPKKLSGGMRRRVQLLTGVASLPHLLLLDEPFSALDEPTRVALHVDLLEIIQRLGMSVILVTHDVGEAITLSDKVLVMTNRPGRVSKIVDTELGWPRDVRGSRETDVFHRVYSTVWHELWQQTEA